MIQHLFNGSISFYVQVLSEGNLSLLLIQDHLSVTQHQVQLKGRGWHETPLSISSRQRGLITEIKMRQISKSV